MTRKADVRSGTVRAAGTLDLTVHLRDPDTPATCKPSLAAEQRRVRVIVPAAAEHVGHLGVTLCGKALALDELWVDYEPEDRDIRCPRCFAG